MTHLPVPATRGRWILMACVAALMTGVAPRAQGIIPTTVPELRPGVLAGYLPRTALPDSLKLIPPPPATGSALELADQEAYRAARALVGTPRWTQSVVDANLRFPDAADVFSCALGGHITAQDSPHLYTLLRRTLVDAGLSTYAAKDHYKRQRPFAANKSASCTPAEESALASDGSYPSGHAALGWAWALVLAELVPDRSQALLARGHAFGQSRVVCGVHWQSDVNEGRVVGSAAVARLHADPVFKAQMDAASAELAALRARGLPAGKYCDAEAQALSISVP